MNESSNHEFKTLGLVGLFAVVAYISILFQSLNTPEKIIFIVLATTVALFISMFIWDRFSKWGRENRKRLAFIRELPFDLFAKTNESVQMGSDLELKIPIYLPDHIRSRHVHIIGATGSGKTESVVLNFLNQDVTRGLGSIILDAKGDSSFLVALRKWVPSDRLRVFDLGDPKSLHYNPLDAGTPLEAAQRLFSSLTWSEEYYASKARSVLQHIFQAHFNKKTKNPTLRELAIYLESPGAYSAIVVSPGYPIKLAQQDYKEISGLKDQINSLCTGHLADIFSNDAEKQMCPSDASHGNVLYFRLQSLMSPQVVATLGKLLINHLSFLAGTEHRSEDVLPSKKIIPVYLDEFASFACPEFADLISKARSAGLALHFSHQSIGDLVEVTEGFLSRITDNSATKIVLRINDPDSAEFFARSFGTRLYQKVTQRITNAKEIDTAEVQGEGSTREAHQFRASPDLFKSLPTGVGSVLVAHGFDTPHGASSVFKIKFPKLKKEEEKMNKVILSLFAIPLITSCSTLGESLQLGASMGAVGGAAAIYSVEKSLGEEPTLSSVGTGAGIGLAVGVITSYIVHKSTQDSATTSANQTEMYFGDLPPSPFIFPKQNKKGGQ